MTDMTSWKEDNTLLEEGLFDRKNKNISFPNQKCIIELPDGSKKLYWKFNGYEIKYDDGFLDFWSDDISEAKKFNTPIEAFSEITDWLQDMTKSFGGDYNNMFENIRVRAI